MGVLLESLKDSPHIAEKVCWVIFYLAQGYEDAGTSSSMLATYLPNIITSLIAITDYTNDDSDSKLQSSAYETLNEVIRSLNLTETSHVIIQLLHLIMTKLEQTLELNIYF